MAKKADPETLELLSDRLKDIKKKYTPEKVILFGSRARGDNLSSSDIDLLIVSSKFKSMNWRKRIIGAFGNWDKKQMLELVCLTPEEFKRRKKQLGIVKQASKEGIPLVS